RHNDLHERQIAACGLAVLQLGRDTRGMPMARVEVKTFYLEMLAPPSYPCPPAYENRVFLHALRPTVPYYRFFYDAVGDQWHWSSRKKLSDAEIAAILNDPKVEMHVLYVDGVPAGFAELDRRQEGEIE